jgi:hypothetical protein
MPASSLALAGWGCELNNQPWGENNTYPLMSEDSDWYAFPREWVSLDDLNELPEAVALDPKERNE